MEEERLSGQLNSVWAFESNRNREGQEDDGDAINCLWIAALRTRSSYL